MPHEQPEKCAKAGSATNTRLVNEVASSGFLTKPQTHHEQSGEKKERKKMRMGGPAQGANKTTSTTSQENKSQIPLPIRRAIRNEKESTPRKSLRLKRKRKKEIPQNEKENTARKTRPHPKEKGKERQWQIRNRKKETLTHPREKCHRNKSPQLVLPKTQKRPRDI